MHGKFYSKSEIKLETKPTIHNFKDLEGEVFGLLTVIGYAGSVKYANSSTAHWYCRCECGRIMKPNGSDLRVGKSKSCGCLADKLTSDRERTHGKSRTPEHAAYYGAKCRCTSTKNAAYSDYGGRGIEFRFNSFEEFYAELGDRPTDKHTLDRIDCNGHYESGNLRWVSRQMQMRNLRRTKMYTLDGVTKTLPDWCGDSLSKLYGRTKRRLLRGYCFRCALTNEAGKNCSHRQLIDAPNG